jgi:hypothetical protein
MPQWALPSAPSQAMPQGNSNTIQQLQQVLGRLPDGPARNAIMQQLIKLIGGG